MGGVFKMTITNESPKQTDFLEMLFKNIVPKITFKKHGKNCYLSQPFKDKVWYAYMVDDFGDWFCVNIQNLNQKTFKPTQGWSDYATLYLGWDSETKTLIKARTMADAEYIIRRDIETRANGTFDFLFPEQRKWIKNKYK